MAGVPGIVVVQDLLRNSVEHLFREDSKQLPSNFEALEYRSILIDTYRHNRNKTSRKPNYRITGNVCVANV